MRRRATVAGGVLAITSLGNAEPLTTAWCDPGTQSPNKSTKNSWELHTSEKKLMCTRGSLEIAHTRPYTPTCKFQRQSMQLWNPLATHIQGPTAV